MTKPEGKPIRAYHFVGAALRDGSPIPADGEWLSVEGPLVMCEHGLHWSRHPFDALQYAPGETLCLVEVDGDIQEQADKGVSRRRKILARFDATDLLWKQARKSALSVIHLWDAPAIVREYLETGDETNRAAARAAAWAAAMDTEMDTAMAAARAAARDTAWAAAMAAARAAARDAADAADAAWDTAMAAARAAAWDTASAAAMAAARDAAKQRFLEAVEAKFKEIS